MRTDIVHPGAGELTYEIRNIVAVAEKIQALGVPVNFENIGDPVAKGETIAPWIKQIVANLAMDDSCYGYCPTQGLLDTRRFLAERTNALGGVQIKPEDIIFFNGLGDAIAKVYGFLRPTARVITPSPTYTTHTSSEAAHAGIHPVSYPLDPYNNWYPDTAELHNRVKYNPAVAGLLLINPDNPTGTVLPVAIIEEIVEIAREFDLFIIADEIYEHIVYNNQKTVPLCKVIKDIPALCMKGISKELPWPGARCGWIEVYNREKDPMFARYVKSILNAKMLEVCSTTLPQKAIPQLMRHPEYTACLQVRKQRYERFSKIAHDKLSSSPAVLSNRTNGAFYMSIVFRDGQLNREQTLPIENEEVRKLVESITSPANVSLDKRFVYYLLASTGLCVVPLSSFNTELQGVRITLLNTDENKFRATIDMLTEGIEHYIASAPKVSAHRVLSRAARA